MTTTTTPKAHWTRSGSRAAHLARGSATVCGTLLGGVRSDVYPDDRRCQRCTAWADRHPEQVAPEVAEVEGQDDVAAAEVVACRVKRCDAPATHAVTWAKSSPIDPEPFTANYCEAHARQKATTSERVNPTTGEAVPAPTFGAVDVTGWDPVDVDELHESDEWEVAAWEAATVPAWSARVVELATGERVFFEPDAHGVADVEADEVEAVPDAEACRCSGVFLGQAAWHDRPDCPRDRGPLRAPQGETGPDAVGRPTDAPARASQPNLLCACPDDRCAGTHHGVGEPCGCLPLPLGVEADAPAESTPDDVQAATCGFCGGSDGAVCDCAARSDVGAPDCPSWCATDGDHAREAVEEEAYRHARRLDADDAPWGVEVVRWDWFASASDDDGRPGVRVWLVGNGELSAAQARELAGLLSAAAELIEADAVDAAVSAELSARVGAWPGTWSDVAAALGVPSLRFARQLDGSDPFTAAELDALARYLGTTASEVVAAAEARLAGVR